MDYLKKIESNLSYARNVKGCHRYITVKISPFMEVSTVIRVI